MAVNTHMPTNMTQPWEQNFDHIMATWWILINQQHPMNLPIHAGTHNPIRDWVGQPESDAVWFYGLDDREEEDWRSQLKLASHLETLDSVHVTTALYITSQISEDLLHDIEIPGVWLCRVQKG